MPPDLLSWEGPAIGLLDLDAFFASVEQLDHPEWRGKRAFNASRLSPRIIIFSLPLSSSC